MLSITNDLAVNDRSDVPLGLRDQCRPVPLVISVVDTESWHEDPKFGYYCFIPF